MIPQFEPVVRESYVEAVASQMRSGWVGFGKTTTAFEEYLAEVCDVAEVIATTSGTTALYLALMALGVDQNTTVFFPSYTFLAGANAARLLGARVELVDINEETLCMDPQLLELGLQALAPHERAVVIFVDHNGYLGPDRSIVRSLCDKYHVFMIEDAAQCVGMLSDLVGNYGILSFSTPKLITTGQGGAVLTPDHGSACVIRQLIDHGGDWRKNKIHTSIGGNFKFNDVLAAYGIAQLDVIHELIGQRMDILEAYDTNEVYVDTFEDDAWMAIHRTKDAKKLVADLADVGIQAVQYYRPIHHNPIYASPWKYPVAEEVYKTLVYLPSSLSLTTKEIVRICDAVKESESYDLFVE
jgi:perosamine synthetase